MRGDISAGPYHHKVTHLDTGSAPFVLSWYLLLCAKLLTSSPALLMCNVHEPVKSMWWGEKHNTRTNVKHFHATCFFRFKTFIWGWWCQLKQWSWTQTLYFLNVPTFYFIFVSKIDWLFHSKGCINGIYSPLQNLHQIFNTGWCWW